MIEVVIRDRRQGDWHSFIVYGSRFHDFAHPDKEVVKQNMIDWLVEEGALSKNITVIFTEPQFENHVPVEGIDFIKGKMGEFTFTSWAHPDHPFEPPKDNSLNDRPLPEIGYFLPSGTPNELPLELPNTAYSYDVSHHAKQIECQKMHCVNCGSEEANYELNGWTWFAECKICHHKHYWLENDMMSGYKWNFSLISHSQEWMPEYANK